VLAREKDTGKHRPRENRAGRRDWIGTAELLCSFSFLTHEAVTHRRSGHWLRAEPLLDKLHSLEGNRGSCSRNRHILAGNQVQEQLVQAVRSRVVGPLALSPATATASLMSSSASCLVGQ